MGQALRDRRVFSYLYKDESIPENIIATYGKSEFNNLTKEEDGGYEPFYYDTADWPVVDGDVILDFAIARTKVHFTGFWEVRGRIDQHDILAVKLIQRPMGILISRYDKNTIRVAVQKAYEERRLKVQVLITGDQLGEILSRNK